MSKEIENKKNKKNEFTASITSKMDSWLQICGYATHDLKTFMTFKTHPSFVQVLEHVTQEQGEQYLAVIKSQNPEFLSDPRLLARIMVNDWLGDPNLFMYQFTDTLRRSISPTTCRYFKVLSDLATYFFVPWSAKSGAWDITEIGCGYGGQMFILKEWLSYAQMNLERMTLIDLPEVIQLIQKYHTTLLSKHEMKQMHYVTTQDMDASKPLAKEEKKKDVNNDTGIVICKATAGTAVNNIRTLVVSNYAWSECTEEVRWQYFQKVLYPSDCGYLTLNFLSTAEIQKIQTMLLSDMNQTRVVQSWDENPSTGQGNCILIWFPKN
jgi:hypothetical protein